MVYFKGWNRYSWQTIQMLYVKLLMDSRFYFQWKYFNITPLCCIWINLLFKLKNVTINFATKNKQANNNTDCLYVCTCTHLSIKAIKGNEPFLHSAPFCSTTSCCHAGGHTFPFIVAHKGYVCCWIIEERGGRVSFLSLPALVNVIPWQCWQLYLLCSVSIFLWSQ